MTDHQFALGRRVRRVQILWGRRFRNLYRRYARPRRFRLGLRFWGGVLVCMAGALGLFAPFLHTISAPAILQYTQETELYPVVSGVIKETYIFNGKQVEKGQVLLVISGDQGGDDVSAYFTDRASTPPLDKNSRLIKSSAKARIEQVQKIKASQLANPTMLRPPQNSLDIYFRAPHSGILQHASPYLKVGKKIKSSFRIAKLINPAQRSIVSYVPIDERARIVRGAKFVFVPNQYDHDRAYGKVRDIGENAQLILKHLRLAHSYGGPIQVRIDAKGQSLPEKTFIQVKGDIRRSHALVTGELVTGELVVGELVGVNTRASDPPKLLVGEIVGTVQLAVRPYSVVQKYWQY